MIALSSMATTPIRPAELARLLAPILDGTADLVLGLPRSAPRSRTPCPCHARLGNRLVLLLVRGLLGTRFRDLPSYKAIRADALRRLDMREMTYGWTVEMLVKARRAGLRIEEVDVVYRPRLGGRSKVAGSLAGSLRAAANLLGCAVGVRRLGASAAAGQWSAQPSVRAAGQPDGQLAARRDRQSGRRARRCRSPVEAYFEVANRCNSKCATCPLTFSPQEAARQLSLDEFRALVAQLARPAPGGAARRRRAAAQSRPGADDRPPQANAACTPSSTPTRRS